VAQMSCQNGDELQSQVTDEQHKSKWLTSLPNYLVMIRKENEERYEAEVWPRLTIQAKEKLRKAFNDMLSELKSRVNRNQKALAEYSSQL